MVIRSFGETGVQDRHDPRSVTEPPEGLHLVPKPLIPLRSAVVEHFHRRVRSGACDLPDGPVPAPPQWFNKHPTTNVHALLQPDRHLCTPERPVDRFQAIVPRWALLVPVLR